MPNVVPIATFRYSVRAAIRRSYGQKYEWRAHRERLLSKEQPTITSKDGTKTLRLRPNDGGKDSSLPLPPIMDPIAVAGKLRYGGHGVAAKSRISEEEMSEFSKALAVNPFAQALATPIRTCTLTQSRLPTHFLQPFTAHFRIDDQKLKAYIAPSVSLSNQSDLLPTLPGASAGSTPSKTYTLNSKALIGVFDRKKNLHRLVTHRMDDAYDKRTRALGRKSSKGDWTWLGQEGVMRGILVEDVRGALERYVQEVPECKHLVPVERLEGREFDVVSGLSARRSSTAASSRSAAEDEVVIPAYDLSRLGLGDMLKNLSLDDELLESPTIGIVQTRHTSKLHLALQRLAMFLGAQTACRFIIIKPGSLGSTRPGENKLE